MAQLTQAFPDREFSGLGGISTFDQALSYFLLGCGTVQVATAAMLDHAIGPNVIRELTTGLGEFLDRNADRGWTRLEDFRGRNRGRIVPQSAIRRADDWGLNAKAFVLPALASAAIRTARVKALGTIDTRSVDRPA